MNYSGSSVSGMRNMSTVTPVTGIDWSVLTDVALSILTWKKSITVSEYGLEYRLQAIGHRSCSAIRVSVTGYGK